MQQRRKVLILASTRKKHKENITSVEDEQEEKANDKSKTKIVCFFLCVTLYRFILVFVFYKQGTYSTIGVIIWNGYEMAPGNPDQLWNMRQWVFVDRVLYSSPCKDSKSNFLSLYKSKLYDVLCEQLLLGEDMLVKIMVRNISQRLIAHSSEQHSFSGRVYWNRTYAI